MVDSIKSILPLVSGEVVVVHSFQNKAQHDAIPEIEYTFIVAFIGQLLQVLTTEQVSHLLIKSIVLQEFLKILIRQ